MKNGMGPGVSHQGPGGLLEGGSPLPGIRCCQDSFMSLGSRVPVQRDRRTGQQKVMVPRSFGSWKLTQPDSCPTSELLASEMGLARSLSTPPAPSLPPVSPLLLSTTAPPSPWFVCLMSLEESTHTCGMSWKGRSQRARCAAGVVVVAVAMFNGDVSNWVPQEVGLASRQQGACQPIPQPAPSGLSDQPEVS